MNVLEKILEEKEIAAIKELIEENEKCFNQCEGACCSVESGICNCDDGVIVQAIHKMKKYLELANDTNVPSKNGWIPVSEKLPEDDDMRFYMCIVENHEEDLPMFCQYDSEYGFGFWHDIYDSTSLGFVDTVFKTNDELGYEKVVAWQPLPEPYKEE
ncbi:MAG: DUF551 domain-containing protein [Lachnospiraceae bacterium]|jgi:hypothetical protein|uniref:DUF551 domain-containing protein n=1 Tax=Siphoviridae sp. ct0zh2 TaxID=2825302 RepID=A0A8S5PLX2_9CAUD|nr:DUF551 domain-containing protein [Lachnospiraceae bacterium]DAE07467.1 MAG TPA: Protein of unknown function (DUF551) [Siphoviridae sp. ct0zh2]